jgi:ABC-type lipoprotein export system ATPase subunit/ABC-type transporter Mla maintaining outer membrane lipid asymmetry permease subunit MlaE
MEDDGAASLELAALEIELGQRRLSLERPCTLRAGRLYLVVGPSGSGKSSLARALLGFGYLSGWEFGCRAGVVLTDAAGKRTAVWNADRYDPASRQHIAFLPQAEKLGFLDGLSVADNLALFSDSPDAQNEIERLARRFHLDPLPERLASASGGERIRLSAIRGLIPRGADGGMPAVVIADEPTAGLDRVSAESIARSLIELARGRQSVVIVISHEPELFLGDAPGGVAAGDNGAHILQCAIEDDGAPAARASVVSTLRMEEIRERRGIGEKWLKRAVEALDRLGAVMLSPLAFAWGLLGMHRPLVLLRQALLDACGVGTQAFSLTGCLLIAGTVAYFIFERMPRPELVEPLLLPEMMAVTGQTLARMVLPLGACGLVATKLGAAQAARLAAAVRGGLLETLALAGWRVEAYALVPVVLAQFLAMLLATVLSVALGVLLAAVVYVAGHDGASLPLTVDLMVDGLKQAPHWWKYALVKIVLSSFLAGTIAALYGIAPSRAEDDVARAVHRTLLWSVLAVIACQCALVLAEFTPG